MPRLGNRYARLGGSLHLPFEAKPKRDAVGARRRRGCVRRAGGQRAELAGAHGYYSTSPFPGAPCVQSHGPVTLNPLPCPVERGSSSCKRKIGSLEWS